MFVRNGNLPPAIDRRNSALAGNENEDEEVGVNVNYHFHRNKRRLFDCAFCTKVAADIAAVPAGCNAYLLALGGNGRAARNHE